jgi:DNA-binding NarL/FixJ family response regulator
LLNGAEAFSVGAQAEDLRAAAAVMTVKSIDVVLVDHGPSSRGIRVLLKENEQAKVLVIGPTQPEPVVAAIASGARGYLARGASARALKEAIEVVQRGELYCTPNITRALFGHLRELSAHDETPGSEGLFDLTPREVEVLGLLARGLKNREIASHLCLSPHTIKNHVHNVLSKLDASDRTEAVRKAYRRGWLAERRIALPPRSSPVPDHPMG